MGYDSKPSWVYKREMAYQSMSHDQETSKLSSEIQELKKENQTLKTRIEEMEAEISDLRKCKFDSLKKDNQL
jgi:predicted RNase H-like nuclease (RuvC/YqgF family)